MAQLKEALPQAAAAWTARGEETKAPIVVDFNAWRHDKAEELWAAFAVEFTNALRKEHPWYLRWWRDLQLREVLP